MKSKAKLLVVLAVIISSTLVVPACGGSQPEPGVTVDTLAGVWRHDKSGRHLQLNEDGTYRYASAAAWLEQAPREVGQYQLEGTTLTLIPSDESRDCKGQPGSYQVELIGEDQLQFVLQEDACQLRASGSTGTGHAGTWSRVEP